VTLQNTMKQALTITPARQESPFGNVSALTQGVWAFRLLYVSLKRFNKYTTHHVGRIKTSPEARRLSSQSNQATRENLIETDRGAGGAHFGVPSHSINRSYLAG